MPLFNGTNLDGWTPKIKCHALGDNFANTFRVENVVICVRHYGYDNRFQDRLGHQFYESPFSNYVIRVEYRFLGGQMPDGPGWALRNSGIMIHCQPPATMRMGQDFPVCIEVQLLGGEGKNPRTTGNLCTPGTVVVNRVARRGRTRLPPPHPGARHLCRFDARTCGDCIRYVNGLRAEAVFRPLCICAVLFHRHVVDHVHH